MNSAPQSEFPAAIWCRPDSANGSWALKTQPSWRRSRAIIRNRFSQRRGYCLPWWTTSWTRSFPNVDLLYIDANHSFEPTLRYMDRFGPHLKPMALVIFDDIHWSKEMWGAWSVLRNRQGFSNSLDVGSLGLGLWQGGAVRPKQFSLAGMPGGPCRRPPRGQALTGPDGKLRAGRRILPAFFECAALERRNDDTARWYRAGSHLRRGRPME